MQIDFPSENDGKRKKKAFKFETSLANYHKVIQDAEVKLIASHQELEIDL
jgi:hypothetical protein